MIETVFHRFRDLGAQGEPAKLGVMGGTFDPIHLGHLRMAEEVREALDLDGVLFVPAGNPVFKKDREVAAGPSRLQEVARAVASNPHFDVSPLEVQRPGDTFTVDTLAALKEMLPPTVELTFILGADAAAKLDQWRDRDRLAELARFAIATGRPDSPDSQTLMEKLTAAAPFQLDFVPVSSLEISSTAIRDLEEAGKSTRYLVTESVRSQEMKQRRGSSQEDRDPAALQGKDPYSPEFFEARKKELAERVSPRRFEHSLAVSATAEALAKHYGVDADAARLAGLLHDWDKGFDDDAMADRVKELSMEDELDPEVVASMAATLHGFTAAKALGREFPELPADVLQAISRHTVADEAMEPLDMVLYIADAIEPGRQFGAIDELRQAVGEVDLEELFFRTYAYWAMLIIERGRPLHPDTMKVWNTYAARRKAKRDSEKGKNRR